MRPRSTSSLGAWTAALLALAPLSLMIWVVGATSLTGIA